MSQSIAQLVDRGLEIDAQLEDLKAEKKKLEETLIKHALRGNHVPLKDPRLEGKRYIAAGTESAVDVVFTSDRLVQTFQEGGLVHQRINSALAPEPARGSLIAVDFAAFYARQITFKMVPKTGQAFRELAAEILGPKAPGFIVAARDLDKHDQPKSDVKILWGDAEPLPAKC